MHQTKLHTYSVLSDAIILFPIHESQKYATIKTYGFVISWLAEEYFQRIIIYE